MKKITALLIAAMLLFTASAFADSAAVAFQDRFEIRADLPDSWHCTIVSQNDMTLEGYIRSDGDDLAAPVMNVFVSFNESYAGVNALGELDDEALEIIKAGFSEENEITFDTLTTDSGLSLLVIRETGADQDFLDFYTIWQGYEIELTLMAGDQVAGRVLTEEQVQSCLAYARTLSIGPVE